VNVGYVSTQLGHADIGVTVRHYAKWCGRSEYRDPMHLEAGEVPADLLARPENSHQTPTTVVGDNRRTSVTEWDHEGIGQVAGRAMVGPPGFEPGSRGKSASNFS
jgi:hypothetical protein